jgi:hypothetical protein
MVRAIQVVTSWSETSDCIRQQPAEHGTHEPPVEPEELLAPVELATMLEVLAWLVEEPPELADEVEEAPLVPEVLPLPVLPQAGIARPLLRTRIR